MDNQTTAEEKKVLTPLEKNIQILNDEQVKNEKELTNREFKHVKDIIALQEYQVKVQHALQYLLIMHSKLQKPPLIKSVMGEKKIITM